MVQVALDSFAKCTHPVITDGEPELERAEAAREIDGKIEERESFDRVCAHGFCIVPSIGKSAPRSCLVAKQKTAAIEWLIEPFVCIERERIGEIESAEFFWSGQGRERSIGSVDMQPEIFFLG